MKQKLVFLTLTTAGQGPCQSIEAVCPGRQWWVRGSTHFNVANEGSKHFLCKECGDGPPYPCQDQQHGCSNPTFLNIVGAKGLTSHAFVWELHALTSRPTFVLGGFWLGSMSHLHLETYWGSLQQSMPYHAFYTMFDKSDWGRCIPFYLHMDGGVGQRKRLF